MATEVSTKISPSLHPDNVREVDGFDDDTAPVLAQTVTAFDAAYQGVLAVHAAREAAKTNPTWNENQVIIETDKLASRHLDKITRTFDAELTRLDKAIAHLEGEMNQPVVSGAGTIEASDIRRHAKELSTGERMSFIQRAIEEGDTITASAILGARPYLSGIDAKTQATFVRMFNAKHQPQMAKRLTAMQGAKRLIEERAGLVFKELEKAVGAPPHKAKALREAKTAAEKHFVMHND